MPDVWQQLTKKAHQEPMSLLVTFSNVPHRSLSARVGTSNAKAGPNMEARNGFIGAITGLTPRWRLAARAKGPLAEDDMGEHWNYNESAQQLTTQNSGIQNATQAQTMLDFATAHRTSSTYVMSLEKRTFFHYFFLFHMFSSKREIKIKTKKKNKQNNLPQE